MSDSITLSPYTSRDRAWLGELLLDNDVRRFLPHLTTDADDFINDMLVAEDRGLGKLWIVRLEENGIGFIAAYDLTCEPFIFYAMLPEYRNKGYMHKAVRLIDKEYSSNLSTVVDANNVRSLKLLAGTTIGTVYEDGVK